MPPPDPGFARISPDFWTFSFESLEGVEERHLPLECLLAGETHRQQGESIAVHEVHFLRTAQRIGIGGLPKIGDTFSDQLFDVTGHMIVSLPENLCHSHGRSHGLAVLDADQVQG